MDKTQEMLETWCSGQGVSFRDEKAQENFQKRARRVADVIQLKVPDRVPVVPSFGMFPALDNGYTCEEVMFDLAKASDAWLKTLAEFEPDMYRASSYAFPGPVFEALDYKLLKLPGRGIPANHVFQFVEKDYVQAEEFYDEFMNDPSDFMLRKFLPRTCGALAPFANLAPFSTWFGVLHRGGLQLGALCHARDRRGPGGAGQGGPGGPEMGDPRSRGKRPRSPPWGSRTSWAGTPPRPSTSSATGSGEPGASCWTCSATRTSFWRPWKSWCPPWSAWARTCPSAWASRW